MVPNYWLLRATETIEFATLIVAAPAVFLAVGYAGWRGRLPFFQSGRYRIVALLCLAGGFLLMFLGQQTEMYQNAPLWVLHVTSFVFSLLLLATALGCGVHESLRLWTWHRRTSLRK